MATWHMGDLCPMQHSHEQLLPIPWKAVIHSPEGVIRQLSQRVQAPPVGSRIHGTAVVAIRLLRCE